MGKRKRRAAVIDDPLAAAKAEALMILASTSNGTAPSTSASAPPPPSPSRSPAVNGKGKERENGAGAASLSGSEPPKGKKIRFDEGEEQSGATFIGPVAPAPSLQQQPQQSPQQQQQQPQQQEQQHSSEEIPATAFLDFANAATDEFIVMNPHLVGPSDIVLPQTTGAEFAKSILYYGDPDPASSLGAKRPPKPQLQYLPMSTVPERRPEPRRREREMRRMATEDSDLDEDDFADVFGEGVVVQRDVSQADGADDDEEGEEDEEGYEDYYEEEEEAWEEEVEGQGEEMGLGRTSTEVEKSLVAASTVEQPAVAPTQALPGDLGADDMDVSSSAPATPPPQSNASVPAASQPPLPTFDATTLTDPQRSALTNALSAQFWAGYHTALLHQSLSPSSSPTAPTSHSHQQQQQQEHDPAAS